MRFEHCRGPSSSYTLTPTFGCLRNDACRKHFVQLIVRRTRQFWHRCQNCAYRTYRDYMHIVRDTNVSQHPVSDRSCAFAKTAIMTAVATAMTLTRTRGISIREWHFTILCRGRPLSMQTHTG